MDIPRTPQPKRHRGLVAGATLGVVLLGTVLVRRLEPAAPSVDRAALWIDSVSEGTMVREVRAPGTLVPERMRLVAALTAGRVERLPLRPGTAVKAGDLLLDLSNPDVQLELLQAEQQLASAEAGLVSLRTSLETQKLDRRSALATVVTEYQEAARNLEVARALAAKGLASEAEVTRSQEKMDELRTRRSAETERLQVVSEAVDRQYPMQLAQVQRLRDIVRFQRERVASMRVTAIEDGVLQQLPLELGQWVVPGQVLAQVAQPGRLKAVLRVAETQAADVTLGMPVAVDTRNGVVAGRVMRVDPASTGGTVTVEVALEGELPRGARADLSVDGTIELERLERVRHVSRPAYGQPNSTVGLFRLDPDGATARRVPVQLGRASVNTVEIVSGLAPGDKVIVSDVSQWDGQDRLRLE